MERRLQLLVLLAPPLAWFLLFFAAPLAAVWGFSFGVNRGETGIDVSGTFANYARALEPLYLGILGRSIALAAIATLICLVAGFPVAVAIAFAPPRARPWLLLAVMLPFWTNLLIRTYALIAVLRDEGVINQALAAFGAGPWPLLHNDAAVVVGLVYVHLPFAVLPLFAALDRLDRSLIEASLDLGAGHLRTFAEIVLPMAWAGVASAAALTFIPALGAYLTPELLGGPDGQMIAGVIERQFKRANDWPFGAALAFLLMYLTFAAVAARAAFSRRSSFTRR